MLNMFSRSETAAPAPQAATKAPIRLVREQPAAAAPASPKQAPACAAARTPSVGQHLSPA